MAHNKDMRILSFIIMLFCSGIANAGSHLHPERWYQERWCAQQEGQAEVRLEDKTRVDCLTETHAVEVDFARKLYEGIGQSLHYALMTGKKAGVLLIVEKPGDQKYWERLQTIVAKHGLPIDVWLVEP